MRSRLEKNWAEGPIGEGREEKRAEVLAEEREEKESGYGGVGKRR